jgi:preflagellin peptidase FlaK
VPDKLWLIYGPIGAALTVYRVLTVPETLLPTVISIVISIVLGFGIVFFGLSGGADAKALICLGLTLPIPPTIVNPLFSFVHPLFPVVVFITAYIASLSVAVWMLTKNLILFMKIRSGIFKGLEHQPTWEKCLAFITGFPAETSTLRSTFYLYPMEKVVEDEQGAHRAFQIYSNADVDHDQVLAEFDESMKKVGSPSKVWVTPGIPLMVFLLVGVVFALTVGDPVFGWIYLLFAR